jgi:hypothetical protein
MAGLALSSTALASDAYPAKPVKIIVGFQAGGPTDVVARLVAKALQDELKGLSSWKTRWVRPATSPRKWWLLHRRWLHLAAGGRTVDDEQIRVPQAEVRSAQELRARLQSLVGARCWPPAQAECEDLQGVRGAGPEKPG